MRPQSTFIDWSDDGTPSLQGFGEDEDYSPAPADPEAEPANAWEDAWYRDGFSEDTEETWFAASREPRGERPKSMQDLGHQVGTVYTHTQTGAIGVIVGWDGRTRAPRHWLGPNLPGHRSWSDRLRRLYAPHYSVLEQRREGDTMHYMKRYIVAHCTDDGEAGPPCVRVEKDVRSVHLDLDQYFSDYDSDLGRYVPRPELAQLYPHG